MMLKNDPISFSYMQLFRFPQLLKRLSFQYCVFLPLLHRLTITVWVYFWVFYLVPLIYISVFMPILHCFDDWSFVAVVREPDSSSSIHKNKPKMNYRPKYESGHYKTPWGKYSRTLCDTNHSNIFFNSSHRIMEIKAKINEWNQLRLKSFYIAKEKNKNVTNNLSTQVNSTYYSVITYEKRICKRIYVMYNWITLLTPETNTILHINYN